MEPHRHANLRALVEQKVMAWHNGFEGLPGWPTKGITEIADEIIYIVRSRTLPQDLPKDEPDNAPAAQLEGSDGK